MMNAEKTPQTKNEAPLASDAFNVAVILAMSLLAWGPLLVPAYFFKAHDARHSVFFLVQFDQSLRDGALWPRWAPDFAFGYGYPLFNLYPPLAFYLADLLHLAGLGFTASVKATYALATAGSGLSMYLFVRRLRGKSAGLLAGVVYMYVPFHLLEIYVRSAFAEYVGLAILPLSLWAFTRLVERPSIKNTAPAGLFYGLLALTHHSLFFMFTPILALYVLYRLAGFFFSGNTAGQALHRAAAALGGGALGIALAAIYLLPLVAETRYVRVGQWTAGSYDFSGHFVYLSQMFSPYWGYGYSGTGLADGMSFQLGMAVVVLMAFAVARMVSTRAAWHDAGYFFAAWTLALVLLMTPAAGWLWGVVPVAGLVQFPWRLLALAAVGMSALAGTLADGESSRHEGALFGLLVVTALASYAYTLPEYTPIRPEDESPVAVIEWDSFSPADRVAMVIYTEEQPTTGPMEAQYRAGEPLRVAAIIAGEGQIETVRHGGSSDEVRVEAETPVTVQFYTYYYPGWRGFVDGEGVEIRPGPPYGLITMDVPPGEHRLLIRFGTTPPRTAGSALSGIALAFILVALAGRPAWEVAARLRNRRA